MKGQLWKQILKVAVSAKLVLLAGTIQAAPVVDVLVLYIDAAQQTTAGRDMDARISSYITYSNQAFENSNVDTRLRLVGVERVDLDYTYVNEANLSALRSNAQVARLRQEYGADLVTLINLRQPMSGGYVCGIGYIPPGDAASGRLYSNASSAGFSLVGVDCGLSTFPHELGHNMSLGHSYVQNSGGGVWPWARGYGVQGLFSTIMAYPQSYGTRNQLQRFSNPEQFECGGQACGVHRDQAQGADAALNLNRLGSQLEAFSPAVVTTDPADEGSEPDVPDCSPEPVPGNLIDNGDFDSLEGWSSALGASRLSLAETQTSCREQLLVITDRTQAYGDAYQDLGGRLQVGTDYSLSAQFGIANGSRDTVSVALRIQEGSAVRYQYLNAVSVTSNELTGYSETFRLDATVQPDQVGLLVYGPAPGTDILADKLVLLASAPEGPSEPDPAPTAVLHERFEQEAQGWASYGSSTTAFSTRSYEGSYSIRNYNRSYTHSGPIRDVTGLFETDTAYALTAQVYVGDSGASTATAQFWIYYVDDQGSHWMEAGKSSVTTNGWQTLTGSFAIQPMGKITQMRLLVAGPRPAADLYLDELTAVQQ